MYLSTPALSHSIQYIHPIRIGNAILFSSWNRSGKWNDTALGFYYWDPWTDRVMVLDSRLVIDSMVLYWQSVPFFFVWYIHRRTLSRPHRHCFPSFRTIISSFFHSCLLWIQYMTTVSIPSMLYHALHCTALHFTSLGISSHITGLGPFGLSREIPGRSHNASIHRLLRLLFSVPICTWLYYYWH